MTEASSSQSLNSSPSRSPSPRLAEAAPALAGLLGFALTLYLFYPGFMVWDSTWQLEQAVTGEINNAHPPIMVRLWALTNHVIYGPAGMLVLQAAGYWAGLALIARYITDSAVVRVALIMGFGFFPPMLGILATVWKDSGSLAALLLAVGLLLEARRRRSVAFVWWSLPFVFYALAVRFNNLLTVLPILWWISRSLVRRYQTPSAERRPLLIRVGVLVALLATMVSLAYAINTVGVRRYSYFAAVPLWDLAQVSLRINQLLVPEVAITGKGLDLRRLDSISRSYRCDYNRVKRAGEIAQDIEWTHLTPEDNREIIATWLAAILDHPGAYLDHRLKVTGAMFFDPSFGAQGTRARHNIFGPQTIVAIESFRHSFQFNERPGYSMQKRIFVFSAESVLCRPWLYLVIALPVWIFGWWRRSEEARLASTVASSGLLSVVPLFVLAPSTDFRYSVWLVAATVVSLALIVSCEIRARANSTITLSQQRQRATSRKLGNSAVVDRHYSVRP